MKLTLNLLGITVEVEDDDVLQFASFAAAKDYTLSIMDELIKRQATPPLAFKPQFITYDKTTG